MPRTIIQVNYGCDREEAERKAVQILMNAPMSRFSTN